MRKKNNEDKDLRIFTNPKVDLDFKRYNEVKRLIKEKKITEKELKENPHTKETEEEKKAREKLEDDEIHDAKEELFRTRMAIANRIRTLMNEAGVSQKELVRWIDIGYCHLSVILNGRDDLSVAQLYDIAQFFRCSPGFILNGESELDYDETIRKILRDKSYADKKIAIRVLKALFDDK